MCSPARRVGSAWKLAAHAGARVGPGVRERNSPAGGSEAKWGRAVPAREWGLARASGGETQTACLDPCLSACANLCTPCVRFSSEAESPALWLLGFSCVPLFFAYTSARARERAGMATRPAHASAPATPHPFHGAPRAEMTITELSALKLAELMDNTQIPCTPDVPALSS